MSKEWRLSGVKRSTNFIHLKNKSRRTSNNELQVDYQYSESFNYDKMGNITLLNRFTAEDISDGLYLQYNGNQLKNVNDNGIQQNIYGLKDYQNLSTATSDEFAYDANGNMTKDLDRDIVTIRYNLLNLPEVIQFRNGNQIKNLYNAGGQKLGTEYFAKLVGIVLPIDKDTVCSWTYASGLVNQKGTIYIDNKEYNTLNGNVALTALSRVHNAEGYVENITSTPNYYYFRKDHLGNNREVWLANSDTTIQRTQYYPSGLPWAEGIGAEVQQKKYNGKEWIEMHGLDEYDSQARMYYPAIMRTTTLDPLAEKYYSISPYAWCGNNPVRNVDPDGRYFDDENEKKAARIERRAERKADRLEHKADRIDNRGGNSGDLRARAGELRQSATDVADMRNDANTEYRYSGLNSTDAKNNNIVGPTTTQTGVNAKGDNVVTMFTDNKMGSKLHEGRHGGDVARGTLQFNVNGGYGVSHEISAYKAQYSWNGQLQYREQPNQEVMLQRMMGGQDPTVGKITNINQINANIVNSMVDPGFVPIYPPRDANGVLIIPLNIWNTH